MAEKPILFNAEMVRAILDGRKTMTRRIIKRQPVLLEPRTSDELTAAWREGFVPVKCPYGTVGDGLWVKEEHYLYGYWITVGKTRTGFPKKRFVCDRKFETLYEKPERVCTKRESEAGYWKRNSLFMPRWASRIQLKITDIRVERVQEISKSNVENEGVSVEPSGPCSDGMFYSVWLDRFKNLWNYINTDYGKTWDDNPWVWVVEFERAK